MKILSIGNSYSANATHYLYDVAKANGVTLKVVNLYIGGCSLARHYQNIHNDAEAYALQFNGKDTGFMVSVREALQSDEWDFVTMQQQSLQSTDYRTFQPYLSELCDYVDFHAPKAKKALHQTWEYENTEQTMKKFGQISPEDMFAKIKAAYALAAKEMDISYIVPSGQAFENLRRLGVPRFHSDPIHADAGIGQYTLSLTWLAYLTGADIANNDFSELQIPITEQERAIAIRAAQDAARGIVSNK